MPGGSLVESIDRCPDGPGHDLQTEMSMSEHNSPTLYFLAKLCTHVDSPFLGAIPTTAVNSSVAMGHCQGVQGYLSKHGSIVGCRPRPQQANAEGQHSIDTQQVVQAARDASRILGASCTESSAYSITPQQVNLVHWHRLDISGA